MSKRECTEYYEDCDIDSSNRMPCQCPVCGGFLTFDSQTDEPICNKCGSELAKVPDVDEETKEPLEWGKICVVTRRKKTTEQTKEERKVSRLVKQGREREYAFL